MIDDLTALRLQLEWGVDETLGDVPLNRFLAARPEPPLPRPVGEPMPVVSRQPEPIGADTLEALHAALDRFVACPLRATATHTVRPSGTTSATVVLIADAPGNEDDRSGHAFSGPTGAMLDRVMGSIGLTREQMLLTTLVPWRPPGGRPASDKEVQSCLPFVHRLLELVRPRVVLLAGVGPVVALTGETGTVRQLRGRLLEVALPGEQSKLAALPMQPLAQWLRDAGTKQQLWSDLLQLRAMLTTV